VIVNAADKHRRNPMNQNPDGKPAILCVDDERIILLALKQELRAAFGDAFDYESAGDATEAMELIEELASEGTQVIILISDWLMPGIKGDEFLIQARERCPGACAIMITGHADQASINKLKETMKDVVILLKPWKAEVLRQAIQACMAKHA
jgi:DNA-binding NtrC family response regulator